MLAQYDADNAFEFKLTWLNDAIQLVHSRTTASFLQIETKTIQNIAYLLAYAGLQKTPFYLFDFSTSGSGKTENAKKCRELFLAPIFELQQKALDEDHKKYSRIKNKDFTQLPKLHKCIHSTDCSVEALFESFETIKSQYIEFGELGLTLKRTNTLIDYIVAGHGANTIFAPNFKNNRFNKSIKIENTSLFFYGDSNMEYMGTKTFFNHLKGGLINRCIVVFNQYERKFEELPRKYDLDYEEKKKYNDIAIDIVNFAKKNSTLEPIKEYENNPLVIQFEKTIYEKKKSLKNLGNDFYHLFHRSIQNFRAILHTIHYLNCFDKNTYSMIVSDETIKEAINFYKKIFFSYSHLIDEINGVATELKNENQKQSIINHLYRKENDLPFSLRDLYRLAHVNAKVARNAIKEIAVLDGNMIISIKS